MTTSGATRRHGKSRTVAALAWVATVLTGSSARAEPAPAASAAAPTVAAPVGGGVPTTPPVPAGAVPPTTAAAETGESGPTTAPPAVPTATTGTKTPAPGEKENEAEVAAAVAAAAAAARNDVVSSRASDAIGDALKLNFYGFADARYTQVFHNPLIPASTFAVGNLNLYAVSELGSIWRSMIEVRFTYLPNGATSTNASGTPQQIDTTVSDYIDTQSSVQWGGIVIERAYLEATPFPWLGARVGEFLTPYGIWNVDHGSPVIIPVRRPFIIGQELFPQQQTGLELFGSFYMGPTEVGYHATLSNGRGPISTYQDLDSNKALGGRLYIRHESSIGTMTLGGSVYKGRYTNTGAPPYPGGPTALVLQYDELSLGGDFKWEWGGLLVQAEALLHDTAYTNGGRPADPGIPGGPPGFVPDHRAYGGYGLVGYRTPWLGIMPYVTSEYIFAGKQNGFPDAAAVTGGLNVRTTPRVVLKVQYTHAWFPTTGLIPNLKLDFMDLQAAWGF